MDVTAVWNGLLDLIAPHRCAGCDAVLDPGVRGFCEGCALLLDPIGASDGGRAAYVYGGPMADAIGRFKYGGRSELAAPLGALLAQAALPLAGTIDVVVPVPLHPRRLRERGYDQAALLARPVAAILAVPLGLELLWRLRDTPPQAGLGAEDRVSNVKAAFAAKRVPERALLVDDVRTTGSTLTECALALRAGGAREVRTLVLARAEG